MRRGVGTSLLVALLVACATASSATSAPTAKPRVTVIGDSVMTAVLWNEAPLAALEDGFDMHLDIGVCRRLTGESCPYEGGRVPTLVDAVAAMGAELAPTVLVEVGYNDDADTFAANVEQSIEVLLQHGAKRILWVNLHGWSQQINDMNADLDAAATRHPELTIVDWMHYASDHWSWFQGDSIHLVYDGAMAMAQFLNHALLVVAAPISVAPTPLPVAHVGRPYVAHLKVQGGVGPYRWRIVKGTLPKRLSLRADGSIVGRPTRAGRVKITVQATDGKGRAATRLEVLAISGRG